MWVTTIEEELRGWITSYAFSAGLMTLLSSLALGLLLLGVYGTLSYRIASMRHEIGVRVAMGARPGALVRAVTGRVARVFALALMVGLLASVPVGAAFRGGELPLGGTGGDGGPGVRDGGRIQAAREQLDRAGRLWLRLGRRLRDP